MNESVLGAARGVLLLALCLIPHGTHAQSRVWKPEKTIELIAPSGPGGAVDLAARQLQKLLIASRVGDVTVINLQTQLFVAHRHSPSRPRP